MNNWSISGRLGRDPTIKSMPSGDLMLSLSVAVQHRTKKGDEWVDAPIWVDVVHFGTRAQWLHDNLAKGALVEAYGEMSTREYEARDGSGKKTQVELRAKYVGSLERANNNGARSQPAPQGGRAQHRDDFRQGGTRPGTSAYGQRHDYGADDDIPF